MTSFQDRNNKILGRAPLSRNKRGYLQACGMHACFGAGSCSEAYMTLCACSCRACLCLCCMRSRACPGTCHGDKGDGWNSRSRSSRSLQLVEAGPRVLTPPRSPPWEGVGSVVLRVCGGSRPSILWLLGASRQGWYLPAGSGDLNVTSCMTPKVRFLEGVVCVLLLRGA